MARTTIPAVSSYMEIHCDFCAVFCTWRSNYKSEGLLVLKHKGAIDVEETYDLCDICLDKLKLLIENFLKETSNNA